MIFNEIYKQYNIDSKIFALLNFITDPSMIDFNVSPDKREIFFKDEKIIF